MAKGGGSTARRAWLITSTAVIYAALALVSGLDRAAALDPVLAGMLPTALQMQSLRNKAANAQSIGDVDLAQDLARKAVASSPIEPASTAILGGALLGGNDEERADQVFRVAAQMGWRVPLTQLYWMQSSLAVGDYRNAALRLDALLRNAPKLLTNRKLLDPLEQSEEGRRALAERLAEDPDWRHPYVADVWEVEPQVLARRHAVLLDLASQGHKLGCDEVSQLVQREVALDNPRAAQQVWLAHCPGARPASVYDGNFVRAQVSQTRSSLAWTFVGNADVSVLPERGPRPGESALAVDGTVNRPTVFVRQLQLLQPGLYRLTWSALTEDGKPTTRLVAGLDCGKGVDWQVGEPGAGGRRTAILQHAGACDAPWLSFALTPGAAVVRLTGVALSPASRPPA